MRARKKRKVGDADIPPVLLENVDDDDDHGTKRRKNPKQAARKLEKSNYNTTVIKCTLNTIVAYAVVGNAIQRCVVLMSKLFYHTHLVMLLLLIRSEGRLSWKGKAVNTSSQLHSLWCGLARVMFRCLSGQPRLGNSELFDLCEYYCELVGLSGSWTGERLGWLTTVLDQMAQQSSTNHETHLTTNLHIYAVRYLYVLIANDDRFDRIKKLNTKNFGMVIWAVTYGDDVEEQEKTIEDFIKTHPSTTADYVAAQKAIEEAKQKDDERALQEAERKMGSALDPNDAVWKQAEVLRSEWLELVSDCTLSEKSERLYNMLSRCRPHGQELQEQLLEAIQTGAASDDDQKRKKMKWAFSLCPVMDYRPKHAPLTSTAIKALFKELAKGYTHLNEKLEEVQAAVQALGEDAPDHQRDALYWNSLFNFRKGGLVQGDLNPKGSLRAKFFTDEENIRFGNFIATDGVGVSLNIDKRKSVDEMRLVELNREIKSRTNDLKTSPENMPEDLVQKLQQLREECGSAEDPDACQKACKTLERKITRAVNSIVKNDATLVSWENEKKELKKKLGDEGKYLVSPELKAKLAPQLEKVGDKIVFKPGEMTVVPVDPGKRAIATAVEAAPNPEGKHEHRSVFAGEWIFISGQKQYTKKMTKRITDTDHGCPDWLKCPSLKTEVEADLIKAIEYRAKLLPKMDELFFKDLWLQKQKMRKYAKGQKARETVTAKICGTKNKVKQKENVVIALGDADLRGNMRGRTPVPSIAWVKHLMRSTTVVLVNEFRTSLLCSHCHSAMFQLKSCFGLKRCINSDCNRDFWNRDVNAAINILDLFLLAAYGEPEKDGCCSINSDSRPKAFRRESKQADK